MKMKSIASALCLATLLCSTVLALNEGDPAPALSIERWVLGEPQENVGKPGEKIYVLGFWATWAKPATESLFILSQLQKDFGKSNVEVIAISAESAKAIEKFLRTHPKRDKLNIRIAADRDQETTIAYFKTANAGPLPHVFLVGKDGTIAWQGHPLETKKILERMIAGKLTTDPDLLARLEQAEKSENWKLALQLIDNLVREYPDSNEAQNYLGTKFTILYVHLKDYTAAEDFARTLLANHADNFSALNNMAWTLMTAGEFENLDNRWPEIAHQAARQAFEATQGQRPAIVDTYARSLYLLGYLSEALALERRAVLMMRMLIDNAAPQADEEVLREFRNGLRDMEAAVKYYEQIAEARTRFRP